jgi:hypothetical protein
MVLKEKCRIDQLYPFFRQFIRDAADKRVGVTPRQIPQHFQHADVRERAREYLDVLDLAGHDGFGDAVSFEMGDHLSELADAHPRDIVRGIVDVLIRLFLYRHDRHRRAALAGAFEHEKRELAITGDESVFHSKQKCRPGGCRICILIYFRSPPKRPAHERYSRTNP